MRVKTLRTIAVSLIFILLDIPLFGHDILPDLIGLGLLFICSIMMTDRAVRFARTAVVSAFMGFLELIQIFRLTESETVLNVLSLLYLFLTVLLVITATDAIAQFGMAQGQGEISRHCDITGHVYALTFLLSVFSAWFPALSNILMLIGLAVTVFVLGMFIYFYSSIFVVVQQQFDPPSLMHNEPEHAEDPEAADSVTAANGST